MRSNDGPLVTIEGLTKRFDGTGGPALDGLTTTIKAGQVTGLVGPDGAGKTTLMRLMAALLMPSEGRLTVCGFDAKTEAAAIHGAIGYMPQRFGLYEDISVIENLTLYADLHGVVGKARIETFENLLLFTGLTHFTNRMAGALSGGMKQKLGLACAMLRSPQLLLLDEPSVGVDPISRRELWRMVYSLIGKGVGVVWSTAYLDEAENCAEVIVLNEGRVLFQGNPGAMTAKVAGRVYQLRGTGGERRSLLARTLMRPEIIDCVMQGEAIRLVVAENRAAPSIADLVGASNAAGTLAPVAPRFEDAFVAMLGGQQKRTLSVETRQSAPGNGLPPVQANALTRRFGTFTAADQISFEIPRGEIFGLLGPNGAGKSTIFKMMCGLLRPSEGIALVDGLDLYKSPSAARARLGYMAQKFSLYGDLSVHQNLDFFAGAYGLSGSRRRQAIERVIDAFELAPHLASNANGVPLGFKQRLALSCAIMHEPPVLFLDEPTSGVDPLTRREFWGFINAMVARSITIMVTTHFMDEAEYCDRVALIFNGKCIAIDTPDALQASVRTDALPYPTLEDAFIGLIQARDEKAA
jgi:ABC-2 type transport system ATP-binding protein